MTFIDDFCQFELTGGTKRFSCQQLGYNWPPPEEVVWGGFNFVRIKYSQITDEQREEMTHVARGALYKPKEEQAA